MGGRNPRRIVVGRRKAFSTPILRGGRVVLTISHEGQRYATPGSHQIVRFFLPAQGICGDIRQRLQSFQQPVVRRQKQADFKGAFRKYWIGGAEVAGNRGLPKPLVAFYIPALNENRTSLQQVLGDRP